MKSSETGIIFLDIDGVLHPSSAGSRPDLRLLPNFEKFLRRFPNIDVVISSTWRESRSLDQLRALFSPDVAKRIIDVTPVLLDDDLAIRQREIESWLKLHPGRTRWIAIDDMEDNFDPACKNLFLCDGNRGLDCAAIAGLVDAFLSGEASDEAGEA